MHDSPEHDVGVIEAAATPQLEEEIKDYYQQGKETGRLSETPQGQLEFARTKDLLQRHLPKSPAIVLDVGGGPGVYACWLASLGYEVHLIDPIPLHVQQAKEASARQPGHPVASCTEGDARRLNFEDGFADAVLLLGPLYHLTDSTERSFALQEAHRALRPGGVIFAVGISRFAPVLDGLRLGLVHDPELREIMVRDLADGQHRNTATKGQHYFTTAVLHQPTELRRELATTGFQQLTTAAIEGPAWLLGDLSSYFESSEKTRVMMDVLKTLEEESNLLGASGHFLITGMKGK